MTKLCRSGENYLKTILIIQREKGIVRSVDVAEYLNVTRPSVSNAVSILKSGGFLTMNDDKSLTLTDSGLDVAERVYEKHCILRDYFTALGVDPETAEEDACRIEHIISNEAFEKIKEKRQKPVPET